MLTMRQIAVYCWLILAGAWPAVSTAATVVRLETILGNIDLELLTEEAPVTVSNFLSYVSDGAYDESFIHRSVPGFVIQGGGFAFVVDRASAIPSHPPIGNEFDPSRSNVRGTVAMAKVGADPNSATNQWFINLAGNFSIRPCTVARGCWTPTRASSTVAVHGEGQNHPRSNGQRR